MFYTSVSGQVGWLGSQKNVRLIEIRVQRNKKLEGKKTKEKEFHVLVMNIVTGVS